MLETREKPTFEGEAGAGVRQRLSWSSHRNLSVKHSSSDEEHLVVVIATSAVGGPACAVARVASSGQSKPLSTGLRKTCTSLRQHVL